MKRALIVSLLVAAAGVVTFAVIQRPAKPLLGVAPGFQERHAATAIHFPKPFAAGADQNNERKNARLWGPGLQLNPGPQKSLECVAKSLSAAIQTRMYVVAIHGGSGEVFEPFPPYLYGTARVNVGKGYPPCHQGGADPGYAIKAFKVEGFISFAEANAKWDQRTTDSYGCRGPPATLLEIGRKRAGGDAYPIRSVAEWRDAHCNGYPLTVAIPWQPGRPYKKNGKVYIRFDGPYIDGHQIAAIGYDGRDGNPSWCIFNSHGANWPGIEHTDGTPPGAAWLEEGWARWCVESGALWAVSDVPGFRPDEIDWDAFNKLN